jgi:hypothetical protein
VLFFAGGANITVVATPTTSPWSSKWRRSRPSELVIDETDVLHGQV